MGFKQWGAGSTSGVSYLSHVSFPISFIDICYEVIPYHITVTGAPILCTVSGALSKTGTNVFVWDTAKSSGAIAVANYIAIGK